MLQNFFQEAIQAFHAQDYDKAQSILEELLRFAPQSTEILNWLGVTLLQKNQADKAKHCFFKSLELNPEDSAALYHYALSCERLGQDSEALPHYKKEVALKNQNALSLKNLALLYAKQQNHGEAAPYFKIYCEAHPQDFLAKLQWANCLQRLFCYEESLRLLNQIPQDEECLCAQAHLLQEMGRLEESLVCYRKIEGRYWGEEYFLYYARLLFNLGLAKRAEDILNEGLARHPQSLPLQLSWHLSLPVIYDSQEQLEKFRIRFTQGLHHIEKQISNPSLSKKDILNFFRQRENFFLAYQGKNDEPLQKHYARIYCSLLPEKTLNPQIPSPSPKIKILFLSPNFVEHSISHTTLGYLKYLNPEKFEIFSYLIGPKKADQRTKEFIQYSKVFRQLPPDSDAISKQIQEDQIDVLFFADVGMDPITLELSMMRLAPIQCTTQGHPVTTGSPHMDYFFSSVEMEGPQSVEHYIEKLVLLSHQGFAYPRVQAPIVRKMRKDFHLPENNFLFLSCQSLYKYTPEYDSVYFEIANRLPQAKIIFVSSRFETVNQIFKKRLSHPNFIFLPRLSRADFFDLLRCMDAYLDGLPWSGNNTTIEALSLGKLPVITYPGSEMRHRHTLAHLKQIDALEGVAQSPQDYVRLACRLATEPAFYVEYRKKIMEKADLLFEDSLPVKELEDFLIKCERGDSNPYTLAGART